MYSLFFINKVCQNCRLYTDQLAIVKAIYLKKTQQNNPPYKMVPTMAP